MTYLKLSSYNIAGPIPIELSQIGNLDTLDLSNNKNSGLIPSSLVIACTFILSHSKYCYS
ncbi:putative non-specific serine/threonine protein kinase [Helianthus anomalus]